MPAENGPEAALAGEHRGDPARRASASCRRSPRASGRRQRPQPLPLRLEPGSRGPDLADLRGQRHLRHALEVAAAGGHSLLMVGPPGAGKSLAASRLPSILPPLAPDEALEVARIASACGRLGERPAGAGRSARRTTRSARPGWSAAATRPDPGEATLAHRGVLFLDELCEFRRDTLEALRAPLETGWVSIARAGAWQQPALSLHARRRRQPLSLRARRERSGVQLRAARGAALPGPAQRRPRRPHRHPRRDPPAERGGDRRRRRGSPRPRCASGSAPARERQEAAARRRAAATPR